MPRLVFKQANILLVQPVNQPKSIKEGGGGG